MSAPISRVSVALCTYNGARFVQAQLESILDQTRLPEEIVICDDGSQDDTVAIVRRITDRSPGPEIRLVQNPTRLGFAKNFEQAICMARGDVIFLSDQDDFWFKEKIAKMMAPFEDDRQVGLVFCDAALTDGGLEPTGETMFGNRPHLKLAGRRSAQDVGSKGCGFNGCMMAFRSELRQYCLPVPALWGHDQWIALLAHAITKLAAVPEPLMYYRRHANNNGNDPDLDGGWRHQWAQSIGKRSLIWYTEHRRRMEALCQALDSIKNTPGRYQDAPRLNEFLDGYGQCLEFARTREALRGEARVSRLPVGLQLLLRGTYHRYARGVGSFAKDMVSQ